MPENPTPPVEPDPIISTSYSGIYLIASILLILSLFWALYDEVYGLRPWKSYQKRFVSAYTAYLKKLRPKERGAEEEIKKSDGYQQLDREFKEAEAAAAPAVKTIDVQVAQIDARSTALTDIFQSARSEVSAKIYEIEHAAGRSKTSLERGLDEIKRGPFKLELPLLDGSKKTEKVSFTFDQLEQEFDRLKAMRADLMTQRLDTLKRANDLRRERDEFLEDRMTGLTAAQVGSLITKMENFQVEIKQINEPQFNLVDRCESCHVGIREPVVLKARDMGGEEAFTSHPEKELLKIHDPDKFGCSPCHNGNGRATTSVEKAHGRYEHWLSPLYAKGDSDAGCVQCHVSDVVLDYGEKLNYGRKMYMERGCMGCHRYEGYDREPEQLLAVHQALHSFDSQKKDDQKEIVLLNEEADNAATNEEARQFLAKAEATRQQMSLIDARMEQLDIQSKNLLREAKKVGPDLKDVRLKLSRDWIPVWLEKPSAFRPTTKMPDFRLTTEERQAIAAFVWQSGLQGQLPKQPMGDPKNGKELFETRGCMACHSIGEGSQKVGGTFAANLSRVGEKANYDYLVRWIHNPRERFLPYCPFEKKDITPADYAKHGLPFVFDLDHSKCPNDGHELQVQEPTPMPSLRLSWKEAQDIASYLITERHTDATYAPAPYMDDPSLKAKGEQYVKFYGCAGCHEIAGLEDEGRIGTDLTKEGSKPIDNFDFALLTRDAKEHGWYDAEGFIQHKLKQPEIYDTGMIKAPTEKLRMPKPNLDQGQRDAITTFLIGSVDSPWPSEMFYNAAGQAKDIQEGWWIVRKYNCMGCHQIRPGQRSILMDLPRYQDPDWKEQLPPRLVGEGARVNPKWLESFLANPALDPNNLDRNGVRPYLKVRMPTFFLSSDEIRKLVRFFMALSTQAEPYIPQKLEALAPKETEMARELFTSKAAPCLKCHATGDPSHDKTATAPNFLLAKDRLKPGWTARWIEDPSMIAPGTSMPSNLFTRQDDRYVFSGPLPDIFKGYDKDEIELLVRYMFQMTPEEQRRLVARR